AQTTTPSTSPAQSSATATEETPPPEEKKPADPVVATPVEAPVQEGPTTTVTVSATRTTNRADRQVFDPKEDPDTPTSVAGDTLNKVPGVAVDAEGNVTLRGNSGVTILVDGKPTALMQGENRAATLQSLASDDIDSIEVMTNPGAQFASEGTGGIINIVMKRGRAIVQKPTLQVSGGTGDRYGFNFQAGKQISPKLVLNGNIRFNQDGRPASVSESDRRRIINAETGESTRTLSTSTNPSLSEMFSINLGATYNIDDNNSVQGSVNFNKRERSNAGLWTTQIFDQDENLDQAYTRNQNGESLDETAQLDLRFDHKGDTEGENLKFNFRYSTSDRDSESFTYWDYSEPMTMADRTDYRTGADREQEYSFSGDYNRRFWGGELATGFDVEREENESVDTYIRNPDSASPEVVPSLNSVFNFNETIGALYATYSKPLGEKWTAMGGLRYEYTDFEIEDVPDGSNNYTNLTPSFHLNYILSQAERLRFSYSKRIQRPNSNNINPAIRYQDDQNVSSGNPNLKPSEADSYEARYEYSKDGHNYSVSAFYRNETDLISTVRYFTSETVLLTTYGNVGEQQQGGLEMSYRGKIRQNLTLNLSSTVAYSEVESTDSQGELYRRTGTNVSGRGQISWDVTAKDNLSVSMFTQGRTVRRDSYTDPRGSVNMTYVRKVSPKLRLVATVTDIFETQDQKTYTRTDIVDEYSIRRQPGQILYFTLRYTFGEVPAGRQQQDDTPQGPRGPRGNWGGGPGGGGPM
ncbi:MAG: hypothetical protein B7Z26_02770, partial [Asticcacaulis sp. 32-58-5]